MVVDLLLGVTLQWTRISHPGGGEYKYSESLNAKETGTSSSSDEPLSSYKDFTYTGYKEVQVR